jgi:DNA ligase 1
MQSSPPLPSLYQKTNTGAIQRWTIGVEGNVITTIHGQVDGKLQITADTITEGKNPGKANATTPEQQAEKEAQAKWTKQKKKGYVESIEDARAGKVDESVIKGGIEPMLAPSEIYPHYKKDLTWPVYTQPKLDGNRCIGFVNDGTLWTRTRKPIRSVPHIVAALHDALCDRALIPDGELYQHEYRDHFEDLMSLIRPPGPVEGHEVVEYWIYDLPSNKGKFSERYAELVELFKQVDPAGPLKLVPTLVANNEDEIWAHHELNLAAEYEGTMIRNDGPYEEGRRSRHLQKLKTWKEAEYPIIGFADGRGKDAGTVAAFYCSISPGYLPEALNEICENLASGRPELRGFKARLKASYDYRRQLFIKKDFIGKPLTLKYQNLTADGKPRFPIGKAIRDYE